MDHLLVGDVLRIRASSTRNRAVSVAVLAHATLFNVEAVLDYLVDVFALAHRSFVVEAQNAHLWVHASAHGQCHGLLLSPGVICATKYLLGGGT